MSRHLELVPDNNLMHTAGTLAGIAYMVGMPVAFIVVEMIAAAALSGWLSVALWAIAAWNLYVLSARTWALAKMTARGAR